MANDIIERYQRIANLRNMAERTNIPEQREAFLRESSQEEKAIKELSKQEKSQNIPSKAIQKKVKFKSKFRFKKSVGGRPGGLAKLILPTANKPKRRILTPQQKAFLKSRQMQLQKSMPPNTDARRVLAYHEMLKRQFLEQQIKKNNTPSESFRKQMEILKNTQTMSRRHDLEMRRRLRERKILESSMNLMNAHHNMNPIKLDFTGVSQDNILSAPSVFKENRENFILRRKRPSILNTKELGNNLRF